MCVCVCVRAISHTMGNCNAVQKRLPRRKRFDSLLPTFACFFLASAEFRCIISKSLDEGKVEAMQKVSKF